MRVAHFLPHYPGRDGSAAFCRGLSRAMNRVNPGACPILTLRAGPVVEHPDEELLRYPWNGAANPFSLPKSLLDDLASNRHRLDGVALHGTYNPPMAALGRHLRKNGIPYLFVPHDPYVDALRTKNRWRKTIYWHVFEKKLIEGARAVQVLDASHEAPLRRLGCRVPTVVIPNGCELSMVDEIPADARVPGADPDDLRMLYFGRMDRHHKGLDLLLEGFAAALKAEPGALSGVTLVMTGNDWTDRDELESLAAGLGLGQRVRFTGRRDEGAMRIVAEADLVVLPSRFDGFGLCIVEAMLAARPVIVSDQAGVAGHVKEAGGGWLTEPGRESIARALVQAVAARGDWENMGRINQQYVKSHLTWDQIAVRTSEVYREVFQ